LGDWATVIADLAHQADRHQHDTGHDAEHGEYAPETTDPARHDSNTDGETGAGDRTRSDARADTSDEPRYTPNGHQPPARPNTHSHNQGSHNRGGRAPGKPMRRHTEIRDRTCTGPRCRAPAHGTDGDHIKEWAHGGATTEANIHSACRHDHRLRHQGGWTVRRSKPGDITWTSRLGIHYHTQPPLIIQPLPDPIPRQPTHPDDDQDDQNDEPDTPIWSEPAVPADDPRQEPTERPPPDPDEPIPF
ncbi:MAG TPA: HNH endonuclease signature motif containing protein, partial [Streptosporangiaceae bacterium]